MHEYWIQVTHSESDRLTSPTLHILNNLRHCTDTDKGELIGLLLQHCYVVVAWSSKLIVIVGCPAAGHECLRGANTFWQTLLYARQRYYWFSVRGALSNIYISIWSWSHLITTNYSSIQTYHVIVKQSSYSHTISKIHKQAHIHVK